MNSFTALNSASQALAAFQEALSVTGNNITNANTAGYTRETTNFGTSPAEAVDTINNGTQYVGTGVSVASITSMRNMFLQAQNLSSSSAMGQTSTQLAGGQQIQSLFTDASGTGISTDLSTFYNAWSSLAAQPTTANLQAVQQAGQQLTADVQGTYSNLQTLQTQNTSATNQTIQQIQTLANQIASLNTQVAQQSAGGGQPNELIDQQQQAIQQLSSLVNVTTATASNGAVSISVGGFDLVDSAGAHTFPTNYNAAAGTITSGNITFNITGGQLAGNFSTTQTLTSTMSNLDSLANSLTTSVNAIMSTGTTANGTTGQNFFNATSTGAATFSLDPAVLSNYKNIATGVTGNTGDTGLATEIANTQTQAVASLGNQTTSQFYAGIATGVGQMVSTYTSTQSTQTAVSTQIQSQIQSVSGVSVDQEMSNMLQYQRSYQAAAQALNIANTTLGDLLQLLQ